LRAIGPAQFGDFARLEGQRNAVEQHALAAPAGEGIKHQGTGRQRRREGHVTVT